MDDGVWARAGNAQELSPEPGSEGKIAVSLWLGRDVRALQAVPSVREVA